MIDIKRDFELKKYKKYLSTIYLRLRACLRSRRKDKTLSYDIAFRPKSQNFASKRDLKQVFSMKRIFIISSAVFIVTAFSFFYLVSAPENFPIGRTVNIEQGATLDDISHTLMEKSVITSPSFFKVVLRILEKDTSVLTGNYFFDKPLSVFSVAEKITRGDFGLIPIKITIPEGSSVVDIAELCEEKFSKFNSARFLELAEGKEGYLFPDTYSFLPNTKEDQIFEELYDTFNKKISSIQEIINTSGRSLEDLVIMASIIEKEAWKEEDRRLISGVLWNRIDIDMPLQVDAAFLYINGKNTYNLTYDDLDIDSPYNTYKYKGLPDGPICNPSLSSLEAAAEPEESDYLFYLSDKKGNTYYAFNFEEHKQNKRLYMN